MLNYRLEANIKYGSKVIQALNTARDAIHCATLVGVGFGARWFVHGSIRICDLSHLLVHHILNTPCERRCSATRIGAMAGYARPGHTRRP